MQSLLSKVLMPGWYTVRCSCVANAALIENAYEMEYWLLLCDAHQDGYIWLCTSGPYAYNCYIPGVMQLPAGCNAWFASGVLYGWLL